MKTIKMTNVHHSTRIQKKVIQILQKFTSLHQGQSSYQCEIAQRLKLEVKEEAVG
jgi:hypothetical protein